MRKKGFTKAETQRWKCDACRLSSTAEREDAARMAEFRVFLVWLTGKRPMSDPAPNLLAREFDGYKPRTRLASDLTYVRVGNSWAYVCLLDLANREIAGHSVGVRHGPELVLAAFATPRCPLGDIEVLHTDRGGGFTGERIERMLDVFGITRSLSGPGAPYDNAVAESTDRLIRKELIYANTYTSAERLRSDVNRYVWWYNHQRLHSTLGYLSPVEFTQQGKTL